MELMILFQLRDANFKAMSIADIKIRELLVKDSEDVILEIQEVLPEIIDQVYQEIDV